MNSTRSMVSRMATAAVALVASLAFAQMGMGQGMGGGMGQGMGRHMPMYDPSTETTVKGTVQDVQEGGTNSGHMGHMHHQGIHLLLKTDDATYPVMVGPSSFVKDKDFEFAKGDQIEVTGSKVKFHDKDALIARQIKKGDKVLTLRDEKGTPEWPMGGQR
ncbi:MAG TPA: hypothetical protein VMU61_00055 [Candidatus Aquilonibacter sp.]|nr:hypothetical protein [Candidatus Aquilonibacter sp.]